MLKSMFVKSEEIAQLRANGELNKIIMIDVNEEVSNSYMLYEKRIDVQFPKLTGIVVNVTDSDCIGNYSCYLIMAVTVELKKGW